MPDSPPPLDLDLHLHRVGLDARPPATLEGLARVHRAQMQAIVFENLDVVLGRGIRLDAEAIDEKLLSRRRGGYCFECNLLLHRALLSLGFDARLVLGRVIVSDPPELPPRTHAAVLVEGLGPTPIIADAGFGGPTPRHPVPLGAEDPITDDEPRWRAVPDPRLGWRMQRVTADGEVRDLYVFDLQEVHHSDLELGNHWTSSHPSSHFTRRPIVARHRPDGRVTLVADRLTRFEGATVTRREIRDADDLATELRETFDLEIDATAAELDRLLALGRAAATPAPDPRS